MYLRIRVNPCNPWTTKSISNINHLHKRYGFDILSCHKTGEIRFTMQIDLNERQALLDAWHHLLTPYVPKPAAREKLFGSLAEQYSHPTRHYHDLRHIREMLAFLEPEHDARRVPAAVQFAVWFHDVVYNTLKDDNETKSAEFAGKLLSRIGAGEALIATVKSLILATHEHRPLLGSDDEACFLDADLAILAAPPERYRQYSKEIRQEYYWVPAFMYGRKRIAILEEFLQRERIFLTPRMAGAPEQQARENLRWEIESLEG